ncbi:hypothetical protein ACS0TY_015914 [Phlomoides rotata]
MGPPLPRQPGRIKSSSRNTISCPSVLSPAILEDIREILAPCTDPEITIAGPEIRAGNAPYPSLLFWQAHIEAGLRFPVNSYLSGISEQFQVPLNQINPSSLRTAIAFNILLRHYGGNPTAQIFHACHDIKRNEDFFYFSSRPNALAHFLGKPTSVDGKWKPKFFLATPRSPPTWNFPCDEWLSGTPHVNRPSLKVIPPQDVKIMKRLNKYTSTHGHFKAADFVRNDKILAHFGFHHPDVNLPPLTDMDWSEFIQLSDTENDINVEFQAASLTSTNVITPLEQDQVANVPESVESPPQPPPSAKRKKIISRKQVLNTKRSKLGKESSSVPELIKKKNKALFELDLEESSTFLQSLPTYDDRCAFHDYSTELLEKMASQKLVQFLTCQGLLIKKFSSARAEILRKELEEAHYNLVVLENDIKELKVDHESQISKLKADHETEIIKLKSEFEETLLKKEQVIRAVGREEGIQFCLKRLFSTSAGQTFLKDLHVGLIDAYKVSKSYLVDMAPHVGHYILTSFEFAQEQAISQGFSGTFDVKKAIKGMTTSPKFKGDQNMPVNYPWWLKTMRAAVKTLIDTKDLFSTLAPASETWYNVLPSSSALESLFSSNILPTLRSITDTNPPLQDEDIHADVTRSDHEQE